MKVRYPNFNFSTIRPHWAKNHEFAQSHNAGSMVPAHIEPYLIRVMHKAKAALDPRHEELHKAIAIFIKQEAQHCKQHAAFNQRMCEAGYDKFAEYEKAFAADLAHFLADKSLRFNCAYSEGFEAIGSATAHIMLENYEDFFEGAAPEVVDLWKWHLAEEFEHRTVAFDVYMTLFGDSFWNRYVYRLYGFFYAIVHLHSHTSRLQAYLLAEDREHMSPAEAKQSKARERESQKRFVLGALRGVVAVLSPSYNPAGKTAPRQLAEYLRRFEPQEMAAAS